MRVCAEPGCPELTDTTRCGDHTRGRDKARGTRKERGYDAGYDIERKRIAQSMASGQVYTCWRCHRVVFPHAWHLGHCDTDRSILHGPEHPACNLGARGACPHPSHT